MTLAQALTAYRQGEFARNEPMARFCGVSYRTACEWGHKRAPTGKVLNKLWFFLEAHGHTVDELQKLDLTVRYLAKLLAFEAISPEAALELLKSTGLPKYLYRATQGELVPLIIKKGQLTQLDLELVYGQALKRTYARAAEEGFVPLMAMADQVPQSSAIDSYITVAAAFIGGLAPLTKRIVEEGEESIKALRAAVGDDVFYSVLDGLKAMSSRKAHQFYRGKGE